MHMRYMRIMQVQKSQGRLSTLENVLQDCKVIYEIAFMIHDEDGLKRLLINLH